MRPTKMKMRPTNLNPAHPYHAQIISLLVDVTGRDELTCAHLDAYLVADLGCDPFEDGHYIAQGILDNYPLADGAELAWIENHMDRVRVRDLCRVFGVSEFA